MLMKLTIVNLILLSWGHARGMTKPTLHNFFKKKFKIYITNLCLMNKLIILVNLLI